MVYKSKKQLKKLGDKQFLEDIKKYIRSSHTFYETRVPELKVLAKRLHQEYDLNGFYRVFNKFWSSGYNEEKSLAISALQMYKEDFDIETWKFIKTKLKDVKSWDKIDSISSGIIGEILIRNPKLEKEIIAMSKSENPWMKRTAIMASIPLIRALDIRLGMRFCEDYVNNKQKPIQEAIGKILREIGEVKPNVARRFISKHLHMPLITFEIATQNMKDMRKLRNIKPLASSSFEKLFFWKKGLE